MPFFNYQLLMSNYLSINVKQIIIYITAEYLNINQ